MSIQSTATPVRAEILVEAPVRRAFKIFTEGMAEWWPETHHILEGELAEMVFEPWVGGGIIDKGVDGSECRWARVLVYEPPERVVFSWDINLDWKHQPDPDLTSEVEIRFIAESPSRTRVELEHRNLDRHGPGWESMRDAVAHPNGWAGGLELFAQHLSG
jgi:uncharacterized protein YndB with AHSA1/START domain